MVRCTCGLPLVCLSESNGTYWHCPHYWQDREGHVCLDELEWERRCELREEVAA